MSFMSSLLSSRQPHRLAPLWGASEQLYQRLRALPARCEAPWRSLSLAFRKQAAMGVVSNVIVQGVISFVILGSLKRAGVIRWGLTCAGLFPRLQLLPAHRSVRIEEPVR